MIGEQDPSKQEGSIPQPNQTQFDNKLYRTMHALEKYKNTKAKIIEGEVIEELVA